ncbi:MAG: LacI family DNA-binding transcriptional regulator [Ardenticatenaceae bacterium]
MATIRDVARAAGVSTATVSRVLNRPHQVREKTRERVQRVIDQLNYRPDPTARRLSMGRTFTVSVGLPFLTRASFVERLRAIEAKLSNSEYDLVVSNVESMLKRVAYFNGVAHKGRFDGHLIISLHPSDEQAKAICAAQVPVVLVDTSHPLLPSVDIDDVAGGRMAAEHLLAKGHRRFGFLGDTQNQELFSATRERLEGFKSRLDESGIKFLKENHFKVSYSRREARQVIDQILARPAAERPTAIFAAMDTTALGLLDGLRQHGLRAPDDLAVIGFDDLDVAELYDLTTIRQPLYESGARGVELLLSILGRDEPAPPEHILLPLTLVERKTT